MSPVSPVFHIEESLRLPFHSKTWQTSRPAFKISMLVGRAFKIENEIKLWLLFCEMARLNYWGKTKKKDKSH